LLTADSLLESRRLGSWSDSNWSIDSIRIHSHARLHSDIRLRFARKRWSVPGQLQMKCGSSGRLPLADGTMNPIRPMGDKRKRGSPDPRGTQFGRLGNPSHCANTVDAMLGRARLAAAWKSIRSERSAGISAWRPRWEFCSWTPLSPNERLRGSGRPAKRKEEEFALSIVSLSIILEPY
jgi:hypothetical protein